LALLGGAKAIHLNGFSWMLLGALLVLGILLFALPYSGATANPQLPPSMKSYMPSGEIRGLKWDDRDRDGRRDAGERGAPRVEICITPLDACTTTDARGRYAFVRLPPDTYTVTETLPAGKINTTPLFRTVSVGPDEVVKGVVFGNTDALCRGLLATMVGTNVGEFIEGTSGDDVIVALGGNDRVWGMGGNDIICGGPGNDKLYGGTGNDDLEGGDGKDRLFGQRGDDALLGGPKPDRMDCGPGTDTADGGTGKDTAKGNCETTYNVP
jgi:Ca2+-binding RTX toxin-like protein